MKSSDQQFTFPLLLCAMDAAATEKFSREGWHGSSDGLRSVVEGYYKHRRLSYPPEFTSIGVFNCLPNKQNNLFLYCLNIGSMGIGSVAVLRNDVVVPEVIIAAHDDIQNLAKRGEYGKIVTLSGAEGAEKLECVTNLARLANSGHYAEARIHRRLTRSDVVRIYPLAEFSDFLPR